MLKIKDLKVKDCGEFLKKRQNSSRDIQGTAVHGCARPRGCRQSLLCFFWPHSPLFFYNLFFTLLPLLFFFTAIIILTNTFHLCFSFNRFFIIISHCFFKGNPPFIHLISYSFFYSI